MGHGDTAHDLDCSPCASETRKPAQGTCSFFLRASPSQSSTVLDNGIIFFLKLRLYGEHSAFCKTCGSYCKDCRQDVVYQHAILSSWFPKREDAVATRRREERGERGRHAGPGKRRGSSWEEGKPLTSDTMVRMGGGHLLCLIMKPHFFFSYLSAAVIVFNKKCVPFMYPSFQFSVLAFIICFQVHLMCRRPLTVVSLLSRLTFTFSPSCLAGFESV
ncbi:hypothetical protein HDV57DRAFT_343157 [Trichoderma longibrachiatum]